MRRYALAGLTIATEMPLPELVEEEGDGPAWAFEWTSDRPTGAFELLDRAVTVEGQVTMEILRDDTRYVLRFPDIADFLIDPSQSQISCIAEEGAGASTVRHLFLDQVVPHVLALAGSLVLHASAVATNSGAVAFVGPSGYGKSSLAASFAKEGFDLLSDDFVILTERETGFVVVPSYPGLRLWPDSVAVFAGDATSLAPVVDGSEKQRVVPRAVGSTCVPIQLGCIVVLGDASPASAGDISLHRMSARDGFIALFEQAFRFGRERKLDEFDRFARLATSTILLRLDYHREYELLARVRSRILAVLHGDP